jgi:hypothetical protein
MAMVDDRLPVEDKPATAFCQAVRKVDVFVVGLRKGRVESSYLPQDPCAKGGGV